MKKGDACCPKEVLLTMKEKCVAERERESGGGGEGEKNEKRKR